MQLKLFILLCVIAVGLAQATTLLSDEEEWRNFKSEHKKVYGTPEEEARRFEIFKDNLNIIREHNKKYDAGEVSYSQGINQFADQTTDEFNNAHFGLIEP